MATSYAKKTQRNILDFRLAMPAESYRVSVVPVCGRGGFSDVYTPSEFTNIKTVLFYRARNAHDNHIYGRPMNNRFVLIDDLCGDDIRKLLDDGIRPSAIIETSAPDGVPNYQVWVTISKTALSDAVATYVARELAACYDGDMGAADAFHLGRLPGLRNRKQDYQDAHGGFPLVMLRQVNTSQHVAPVVADMVQAALECNADTFSDPPSPSTLGGCGLTNPNNVNMTANEARELYNYKRKELAERFGWLPKVTDRSAEDFAIAKSLLYDRMNAQEIEVVLSHGSGKALERGVSYVDSILRKL